MTNARLSPRQKPWPPSIDRILSTYPQGPEGPIALFRTLAHSERTLDKVGAAGLLDRASPVDRKHREVLILRTSFRCHTSYEWGIHVVSFSSRVGLTPAQVQDTCREEPDPSIWNDEELLLIRVVDELASASDVTDESWHLLSATFGVEQILEILMLVGFYHMIAFFNNALRVDQEPGTPRIGETTGRP